MRFKSITNGSTRTAAFMLAVAAFGLSAGPMFRTLKTRLDALHIATATVPKPTGPHGVAKTTVDLELWHKPSINQDRVKVDIWYPTLTLMINDHVAAGPAKEPRIGLQPRAAARVDGPVAALADALPVLLYVPGWGGARNDNTFLFANLASHGYVVVSRDDPSHERALPSTFRDQIIAPADEFDLSTTATVERSQAVALRRLSYLVASQSAVLDALQRRSDTDGLWPFQTQLNLAQVGALGFSFGGAVAAELSLTDPRVVSVLNLDGWLFGRAVYTDLTVPFLTINSDVPQFETETGHTTSARRVTAQLTIADRGRQMRQAERLECYPLLARDAAHSYFTDELFSPSLIEFATQWGFRTAARLRFRAELDAHIIAFYQRHHRPAVTMPIIDLKNPRGPVLRALAFTQKTTRGTH